jgi:hypothetical protein
MRVEEIAASASLGMVGHSRCRRAITAHADLVPWCPRHPEIFRVFKEVPLVLVHRAPPAVFGDLKKQTARF